MIDPSQFWIEDKPSAQDSHFNWQIRRAPADKPLSLILLSKSIFGIRTHYWAGRTGPCVRVDCEACKAGRLSRWTGYLAAIEPSEWCQVLFEFTPPAAEQLAKLLAEAGTLRGQKVIAARAKKAKNARVTVIPRGSYEYYDRLPAAPDVLPLLLHIWGLRSAATQHANGYERDDVPESGKSKLDRSSDCSPSAQAVSERLLQDLAGQGKLFGPDRSGNGRTV